MKRLLAVLVVTSVIGAGVLALPGTAPVAAQAPAATQRVAFIVRVPQLSPIDDPSSQRPPIARSAYANLTRSLAHWSAPPLDEVPVALAVSPALCDELAALDRPDGRPLLRALRTLAQRADVLTVPYADVWLPFLPSTKAVKAQLSAGVSALQACLGLRPSSVLFGHVLHTDGAEPADDLDDQTVAAARDAGIDTIVGSGPTQTPVRTGVPPDASLGVVPFSPDMPALSEDGSVRDAPSGARVAIGIDANASASVLEGAERLAASDRVTVVRVDDLVGDAPQVSVAFPDDPAVDGRSRTAVERATEAADDLSSVLRRDDRRLRTRLKAAVAYAVGAASKDEAANLTRESHRRTGRESCERFVRYVERELDKVTVAEGSVTFTSRRGSVPVTVSTKTTYPIRVRVSVESPKLEFPARRTRVVTIEPPGDTITFAALARASGTFLLKAAVKDPSGELKIDDTQLTVRSTAANLPVLILTIAGALLLLVMYIGRVGRRRRKPA